MSTQAYIMAMGPLSRSVLGCLEYPASRYKGCPDGTIVFSSIGEARTRGMAQALASVFGCDIHDFATHRLNIDERMLAALDQAILIGDDEGTLDEECMGRLRVLARASGWSFFFRLDE